MKEPSRFSNLPMVQGSGLGIWPEMRPPKQAWAAYEGGPGTTLNLQLSLRPQQATAGFLALE